MDQPGKIEGARPNIQLVADEVVLDCESGTAPNQPREPILIGGQPSAFGRLGMILLLEVHRRPAELFQPFFL